MTNNPSPTALPKTNEEWMRALCDAKGRPDYQLIQPFIDKAAADGAKRMQHKTQDEVLASLSLAEAGVRIRQLDAEQISKGE